ncbi:AAA family ATPase [uncultured Brevundimonas sp.]|uniref:ATP-binding protein n=1 Tax=uncultured Brevundimonas sp. TaxID=213418 RepID=UPI0025E9E977|nr:AAA family ATPase [uncultured Brevundimonas sp.]
MKREVSILFGLSGVGKTTMGRRVIDQETGIYHVSASDLLKAAHSQTGEELRTAQQDRLVENQQVLASALSEWPFPAGTRHILLDAHSVIDNDKVLVDIPVDAIASLKPSRLIFLTDDPAAIATRRLSGDRPRPVRTTSELNEHQERSLTVCRGYSEEMGVSLVVVKSGDLAGFRAALAI